jgi:site-specific DNA-methyltransferase (adenine-specific)
VAVVNIDQAMNFNVMKIDAFGLLETLGDETIDCIIVDIAYESLELHRGRGTTTRLKDSESSSNEWFETFPDDDLPRLFAECYRVLKPGKAFYFFGDEWTVDVVKSQQGIDGNTRRNKTDGSRACDSGFRYWKSVIWGKTTLDGEKIRGGIGYHFAASSERVMFFEKRRGKKKLKLKTKKDMPRLEEEKAGPDIMPFPVPDQLYVPRVDGYPTEKPVALGKALIGPATNEGDLVLDFMCGSGAFGVSAIELNRRFIGGDIEQKAVDISMQRLAQARPA